MDKFVEENIRSLIKMTELVNYLELNQIDLIVYITTSNASLMGVLEFDE